MPSSPKFPVVVCGHAEDLLTVLGRMPDPHDPHGVRYPLAGLLAIVPAVVAGARSFTVIGEWAAGLSTECLAMLGLQAAPEESTLRKLFARLDVAVLDRLLG